MTIPEFKKIARLLKQAYFELEQELLKDGLTTLSSEFQQAQMVIRETILKNHGFTLEEYRTIKDKIMSDRKTKRQANKEEGNISLDLVGAAKAKLIEFTGIKVLSKEEINEIARRIAEEVAKKYIKPPQIINKIVKEITVEKPTIVKETKIEKKTEQYDDKPLQDALKSLQKRVDELPSTPDHTWLKNELKNDFNAFTENFERNIDILGMPDFRKLAMGLQGQIDELANDLRDVIIFTTHGITIDGGGAVITTGLKGMVEIPFAGTITRWTLISTDGTSGAIVVDVWKDTYANFPPTVADTMIATGTKPTITATGNKGQNTTVDWAVTTVAAGDVLGFNVDSVTSLKKVTLILTIQHT